MSAAQSRTDETNTTSLSDRLFDLLDRLTIVHVVEPYDRERIFELRYKAYRHRDYIEAKPRARYADALDEAQNTSCFGLMHEGRFVSSIRLHHLSAGQPFGAAVETWPDLLESRLAEGETFSDFSRFVCDPEMEVDLSLIRFATLRLAFLFSVYHHVDYALQNVRPRHGAFYRRYFFADPWAQDGAHPQLNFPLSLFATRMGVFDEAMVARLPFLNSLPVEGRNLFDPVTAQRLGHVCRSTAKIAHRMRHGGNANEATSPAPMARRA